MNFQPHRVDTSQLAHDDGVSVMPIQFAGPEPSHVETASVEDEEPIDITTYIVAALIVLVVIAAAYAGYRLA
jgi:flagellar biosynthesis/type III secretory pathway M-ring protein FliF/YscJ